MTHNERRFQFRLVNRWFRVLPGFMGKSLVQKLKRGFNPSAEVQKNATTKLAHVHEQSEFIYGACLVAAGHLKCYERGLVRPSDSTSSVIESKRPNSILVETRSWTYETRYYIKRLLRGYRAHIDLCMVRD